MAPVSLLSKRIGKLALYQSYTSWWCLSESASVELDGSSMMTMSPPRPVSVPSIDVASRKPFCAVTTSAFRVFDDPREWRVALDTKDFQDRAEVVVMFYRQIKIIADHDHAFAWIATENECWKRY